MAKRTVLQLVQLGQLLRGSLESKFDYYALWEQKDPDAFLEEYGSSIRAVVSHGGLGVSESLLEKLPNLEIVSLFSVGIDKYDVPLLNSRGIAVTNTPDVLTDCVAETAFALLLTTMRRIIPADRYVRAGMWATDGAFPLGVQLCKKHVGIVGLGRIGAAIAKRVECFGGTVSYWSRAAKPQFATYTFYDNVVNLAKDCSILIVACAWTKETTKLVDRAVLDALGPHGYLVNIARGPVIDEEELVKVLLVGGIAGAGLDVFENEPHVPEELYALDNVVLLPHLGSSSFETRQAMVDVVVGNIEAQFSNKPLLTPL